MSRTGRRPGTSNTKAHILNAARREFGAHGYRATTFRTVAEGAGVDPALITHYFGSKEALFAAALELPAPPLSELSGALATLGPPEAAQLIVRTYLTLLANPRFRDSILALVRSAVAEEQAATMLREFLSDGLITIVANVARGPSAELRASLIAAQLIGVAMLRHVLGVESLKEASIDDLVSVVAPVVARYLE
ncbi:MAG TPA: TetR family transcriptional regulator [Acidimicrobiales bacterium]|nr:TetR family transcriptional regulator [Acidimicrobiales bacterium]